MGERIINPQLQELYDNNIPVYSISRLDNINNCLAGAYKTYILHEKGKPNVYSSLGGRVHDVLEAIVNGEAEQSDLQPAVDAELYDLDMLGIEFPKDRNGGDTIRNGWISNMKHFCATYVKPVGEFDTEQFFLYKSPKGRYLQGYIDLQRKNSDGTISIYDYKTSSMYTKEGIKEHGRQLVLYATAKEQEGYKVKDVSWIFLKYVDVEYMGYKTARSKEKTLIKKTVERRKLGTELASVVETMFPDSYDEIDRSMYIAQFAQTSCIEDLPQEVAAQFKITCCEYTYEITDSIREECNEYIDSTIDKWEAMNPDDEWSYTAREFTRITKAGKEVQDSFFCSQLCEHSETCKWYRQFVAQWADEQEEEDLF